MNSWMLASLAVVAAIGSSVASGQNAKQPKASEARRNCAEITDAQNWPNPFITVNPSSVTVAVHGASTVRQEMPLSNLAVYLKALPESAWQCGKVVAASENGLRGPKTDDAAIKENCSRLKDILRGLSIEIDWWPSA
jgi:hypothetical protein